MCCDRAPTLAAYQTELAAAGFTDIELTDLSAPWTDFVRERRRRFSADRERHLAVHGAEIVAGLEQFYAAVGDLFTAGNLGGLRLTARRPPDH